MKNLPKINTMNYLSIFFEELEINKYNGIKSIKCKRKIVFPQDTKNRFKLI